MYRAKFMATTAMALMLGLGASAMAAGSGDQESSGTTMQPGTTGTTGQTQPGATGTTGETQPGATGTTGEMGSSTASVEKWRAQADQVIGQTVVTPEGEDVGEVDDLVLNPSDQSVHAIIGVGGFLGMGEKKVAVPADELQMQGEEIVLAQSKDELEQMAEYNGQWQSIAGEQGTIGDTETPAEGATPGATPGTGGTPGGGMQGSGAGSGGAGGSGSGD